jgi:hypothetical protein
LFVVLLQLLAACAQGYATEPPQAIEVPSLDAGHPVFTGEACTIGDREACTCPEGGTGLRACVSDSASPTGGKLSECLPCDAPASYMAGRGAGGKPAIGQTSGAVTEPQAGKPAMSSGGSGGRGGASSSATTNAAGKGGAGGASGRGGTGGRASGGSGGAAGKAATGSGGSGGRTSTTSSSKSCSSDCAQQLCFPIGVLGCCRSNGTCGCTWAPGAYCM